MEQLVWRWGTQQSSSATIAGVIARSPAERRATKQSREIVHERRDCFASLAKTPVAWFKRPHHHTRYAFCMFTEFYYVWEGARTPAFPFPPSNVTKGHSQYVMNRPIFL